MRPYYEDESVTLYHGDCREILPNIGTGIVITDPPYGVTDHAWDEVVDPSEWMIGETCVSCATEPYATDLITSSPLDFRYDLVWIKNTASNHFNARRQPLRQHERLLVFGKADYYPVKVTRTPLEMSRLNKSQRELYPEKFPGSVLDFPSINNRSGDRTGHPSQKPIDLMRWLVDSFTDQADTVIDPFAGAGTTLLAARRSGRKSIGIERDESFCEIAAGRLQSVLDLGVAA